jgi:hypothetical protein
MESGFHGPSPPSVPDEFSIDRLTAAAYFAMLGLK